MKNRMNILFVVLMVAFTNVWAQQRPYDRDTYYGGANGKTERELKTALGDIIKNHTSLSYGSLNDYYSQTDLRSDGKIWDMYSDKTNYTIDDAGSGTEGAGYNKEHSVPKSWFDSDTPMYSDIMHIVPVDSWVNSMRSNLPYGETSNPTKGSNNMFSKIGPCDSGIGYSGTVFEPNNEYKGDFARIYFYMVTCYEYKIISKSWSGGMFQSGAYPAFQDWALQMLLRWSQEDPVSQKEIDRNNAVYQAQGNRNPYVDFPGLEQLVWGDKTDVAFYSNNYSAGTVELVATPTIYPTSGTYIGEQTVTITCSTEGATIHYTTDGTMPTATSDIYNEPFTVSESTVVKAIAILNDASSRIASVVISIKDGGSEIVEGTIWSEDFTGYPAETNVADVVNVAAVYSSGDNGQYTKLYGDNNAGGEAPELLVPRSDRNSYFQAEISLGGASGNLTLTFNANNKNLLLTTTTEGVTIENYTYVSTDKKYTFPITVAAGVSTMTLKFETTNKSNTRVDNFLLVAPVEQELIPVELAFSSSEVTATLGEDFTEPTLNITPSDANITVTYSSDNTEVATVNPTTGEVTLVGEGAANIIASFEGDDTYMEAEDATYLLIVSAQQTTPVTGEGIFAKISSTEDLEADKNYLLVYEATPVAYAGYDNTWGLSTNVTISNGTIDMDDDANAEAHVLVLQQTENGNWTIKDGNFYLALTQDRNTLATQTSATAAGTKWTISFTDGQAYIKNVEHPDYYLQYNSENTYLKFRCYKGTQKYPALYKEQENEEVTLTIGSAGVATFASNYDLDFTDVTGMKAYIASGFNPKTGKLVLTRVKKVPAGTGLFIKGTAGTYTIPMNATSMCYANLLEGVTEDISLAPTTDDMTNFILANGSHGIGFYKLSKEVTVNAGKAYLALPTMSIGNLANGIMLEIEDETTSSITNDEIRISNDGVWYTLDGRKLNGEPTQKGVYIVNGRKVVK
ncbi:MAG: endonuclease [Prevotella sp.]|nr:endonuclease [Prevotella sp.]